MSNEPQKVEITNVWSTGLNVLMYPMLLLTVTASAKLMKDIVTVPEVAKSEIILMDPMKQTLDTIVTNKPVKIENGMLQIVDKNKKDIVQYPLNRVYKMTSTPE